MSHRTASVALLALLLAAPAILSAPAWGEGGAVPSASTAWQLEAQSDDPDDPLAGYTLYQRETHGNRALKIRAVFAAPPSEVIRAIVFRLRSADYLASGETRRKLHESDTEIVNYSVLDLPMVSDRDVAIRAVHSRDAEEGPYRVVWSAADELAPPTGDGLVRMKSEGFWHLSALPGGRTLATGESHISPGGFIPGWLATRLMQTNMIENLATIRRILRDRKADLPQLVFESPGVPAVSAGSEGPRD